MRHALRRALNLVVVAGLLLALGWLPATMPVAAQSAQDRADEETETGVEDNTYTSPTWGYTLEWDEDVWEPSSDDELIDDADALDRLLLESEAGLLYVEGVERYDGDIAECVEGETEFFSEGDDVEDFAPLEDEDGDPIADEEDDRAFAAFTFTLTNDDGDEGELATYVECRVLVEDEAVLILTLGTSPADFEDEFEAAEEVFTTIALEGEEADTDTDSEDQTVTDEELIDAVETFEDIPIPPDFANHTEEPVDYEQSPPVGGEHHPVVQDCGFYDEPVSDEHAVHSLEHGAVWITYDPELPEDEIAILEELTDGQTHVLVSPYEDLPSPVVASAWGVQLELAGVDDPYLEAFVDFFQEGPQTPEPGAACDGGTSDTA